MCGATDGRSIDDRRTRIQKLDGLERALRLVITEQGAGRGGEDLLKGYVSQFGKDIDTGETPKEVPKVANERQADQLVGFASEALKNKTHTREFLLEDLRRRGVPNPELLLGD